MLRLSCGARIFASTTPVDANRGIDGLVRIVRDRFGEDPFTGDLFCFFNTRRDRVKLLVWDRNGFWLLCKRLERGRFERINFDQPRVELDRVQMAMLLEGIDTRTWRFSRNFERDVCIPSCGSDGGRARVTE
jgi:transposase